MESEKNHLTPEGSNTSPLWAEFERARSAAIEASDQLSATSRDNPNRPILQDTAINRTEIAKDLLQRWLATDQASIPTNGSNNS